MTETTTLQVDLGSRSYPIHIGPGLLDQPRLITDHLPARRVMVVTNETVAPITSTGCWPASMAARPTAWCSPTASASRAWRPPCASMTR